MGCFLPRPVTQRFTTIRPRKGFKQSQQMSGIAEVSSVRCVMGRPFCRVSSTSKIGRSIIEGKTVTGFTIEGELIFKILDRLRADKVVPVVEAVTAVGAYYSSSMNAFDDYSITSGRVVTGTNPQSARSAAERAVKLFSTL